MRAWLKANGGAPALVVLGVGITGFTNHDVGLVLIGIGVLWFCATSVGPIRRWLGLGKPDAATEQLAPLERWLTDRIQAYADIMRQRRLRGDRWALDALQRWDHDNACEMTFGKEGRAPELVDRYRENPDALGQTDGVPPPHSPADYERYYERRVRWLQDTFDELRRRA